MKVEPATSSRSRTTIEEVEDEDDKGPRTFGKPSKWRDKEDPSLDPDKPDGKMTLSADEVVQEFTRTRYPNEDVREKLRKKHNPAKEPRADPAAALRAIAEHHAVNSNNDSGSLTKEDIPRLRKQWMDSCKDILNGVPEKLPPMRGVNHHIPLMDDNAKYNYHLPRCPDSLKKQLMEKITRYTRAGWWESVQTDQAAPMLCIPKKNGKLRTAIDCRKRNDNTVKDVTPFPDQDQIRLDVARAKVRSKIDFSDAYEQVLTIPEDVWKSAFATIYGTYVSHTMQIGDCNAPATFQRVMTMIFRDFIGVFLHVYLDDLFIYSDSIEEHEKHLGLVFQKIRENLFYLQEEKCELYSDSIDCLGHLIDDRGLHADADKMSRIRHWRTPRTYNDVQRFLGLVQYLAQFLPDVSAYTSPLSSMTKNGQSFFWRPLHATCFQRIKDLCCKTPVLVPVDHAKDEPIWVICDASVSGVGAMYGQGPTWQTCRPAGFMSKKFSDAQRHYRVFEQETIAILEALLKWEDKLIGYRVHVVTDHKALEFFKTQRRLSGRQMRWMEYLSRFDFDIRYIKGELNKVSDCLSRYYESDTWEDVHEMYDFAQSDIRLDPTLDDIDWVRRREIEDKTIEAQIDKAKARMAAIRDKTVLNERIHEREIRAREMNLHELEEAPSKETGRSKDPTIVESLGNTRNLRKITENDSTFVTAMKEGYASDAMMSKILANPKQHPNFQIKDGLIWRMTQNGEEVVCMPKGTYNEKSLHGTITEQAHEIVGHYGTDKTVAYIRRWYWWPKILDEVKKFCDSCTSCQRSKSSYQLPPGLLHSMPIPEQPWDSIAMDFVGPFPEVDGKDYLWVIICRLTSMVHLVPIKTTTTASQLSDIYIKEIVRLHGLPSSIVSDRDTKFTSKWWKEVHRVLGAKLLMSTAFHPQTDGATERAIRNATQILRSTVRPDQRDWLEKCPYVEFAINSSVSKTTGYSPFELNGGYMPSMIRRFPRGQPPPPGITAFASRALQYLADAHDSIIESRVFQRHYANEKRREDPVLQEKDLVYLSTKNLNLPKKRAHKLLPKFVGPYAILKAFPDTSNYKLDLPEELAKRGIHDVFHVSLLRPHRANDEAIFPNRSTPEAYDFGAPEETEWYVDSIIAHRWSTRSHVEFKVLWNLGDFTWEPLAHCNELAALDEYLTLMGVSRWQDLEKGPGTSRRKTSPRE
jgi:hypothetical protein